jgi:hypothetical protein
MVITININQYIYICIMCVYYESELYNVQKSLQKRSLLSAFPDLAIRVAMPKRSATDMHLTAFVGDGTLDSRDTRYVRTRVLTDGERHALDTIWKLISDARENHVTIRGADAPIWEPNALCMAGAPMPPPRILSVDVAHITEAMDSVTNTVPFYRQYSAVFSVIVKVDGEPIVRAYVGERVRDPLTLQELENLLSSALRI